MALRDYLKRPSFEPKPTEPPPRPRKREGQVHTPARLLVVLAGFLPCAPAVLIALYNPPLVWLALLQIAPYAWLLRERDPDAFFSVAVIAGVICVLEGLMLMIVGVVLALPTVLLLALAVQSTKGPSQLRRNVPALAGLWAVIALVLLIVALAL
ncbi:hypothetical protein [Yinghuangia soli]|uniref:Uncharacterized protein n=1 Tax=Yinghuangia soli TaxID=2908204 RepID=A0AA41Q2V2_9ACTN|nr:hypothetical protein [Yinghuangia soli]MCF2530543.1 hypothetical protein [Yinghuangia soli]